MDSRLRRYQDNETDTSIDEIANGSSNHGNNTTLRNTTTDFGVALIKSEVQPENILNHFVHQGSNNGGSATGKIKLETQRKKKKQQTKIEV